jgi:hypothetical protein
MTPTTTDHKKENRAMVDKDSTSGWQAAKIMAGYGIAPGGNEAPWRRKPVSKQSPSERQAAKILGPLPNVKPDPDDDELEDDEWDDDA